MFGGGPSLCLFASWKESNRDSCMWSQCKAGLASEVYGQIQGLEVVSD